MRPELIFCVFHASSQLISHSSSSNIYHTGSIMNKVDISQDLLRISKALIYLLKDKRVETNTSSKAVSLRLYSRNELLCLTLGDNLQLLSVPRTPVRNGQFSTNIHFSFYKPQLTAEWRIRTQLLPHGQTWLNDINYGVNFSMGTILFSLFSFLIGNL